MRAGFLGVREIMRAHLLLINLPLLTETKDSPPPPSYRHLLCHMPGKQESSTQFCNNAGPLSMTLAQH